MIFIISCNGERTEKNIRINDNTSPVEISNEKRLDDSTSQNVYSNNKSDEQNFAVEITHSISNEDYKAQKIFKVDFIAETHVQVQDIKEYYSDMDNIGLFTYSSRISEKLCELIIGAMENDTEQDLLTSLMVGEEISEKEYSNIIGVELNARETVYPVKIDGDNDGIEDFMRLYYWGGTGGFSSAEFYKGIGDGNYTLTQTFICFIQKYNFLQYEGKRYLLMEEFDYNTKYFSGYTLYLYENGVLADGKIFSYFIDNYDVNIAYEEEAFTDLDIIKKTLLNTKLPEILQKNDGVIYGTAETKYNRDVSKYEYSADINNDGIQEYFNKWMWYPSNMGTVMECMYESENSTILDDLQKQLAIDIGDGRLYTFWLDEVKGDNILYLYYGNNLNYSLYAFIIS